MHKINHANIKEWAANYDGPLFDGILCDPPYELGFMGKSWDSSGIAFDTDMWADLFKLVKPGGHLLAFSGSRTYHRMAVAIEDAGFEIRDMIEWLYGSGFPKSLNIGKAVDKLRGKEVTTTYEPNYKNDKFGKGLGGGVTDNTPSDNEYNGYGTALKPAHEPCVLARKPIEGTVANNVLKHGTGGLNIDGTRVEAEPGLAKNWTDRKAPAGFNGDKSGIYGSGKTDTPSDYTPTGRFPANLIHDGSDEVEAVFPQTKSTPRTATKGGTGGVGVNTSFQRGSETGGFSDSGSASRFFYTAKSSRAERNSGLDSTRTIKYNTGICKDDNIELVQLLRRATSELTMRWLTDESGVNIMAQCQSDSLSTILTTINKITTSQILSLWMHSHTNESTQAANSEMASGGSLARSAESSSSSAKTNGISQKRGGLSTEDVSRVISELLSLIKDEENWQPSSNIHSTVKPLSLTKYLATLIKPPTGGRLLVPFSGSGSEMIGALQAGWEYVEGVELTEEYIPIAEARIKHWVNL